MPSIVQASKIINDFNNLFVSPFWDAYITPIYSSVYITQSQNTCLPCYLCGNEEYRKSFITSVNPVNLQQPIIQLTTFPS